MLVVALTSIPPRFAMLPRVLAALQAQTSPPDRILVTLPRKYARFAGNHPSPALPDGVEVLETETDLGPAGKVIPAARALAGQDCDILYCDDDWLYAPGWAAQFLRARAERGPDTVIAGTGFDVARLGLSAASPAPRGDGPDAGYVDIAQGYSGVLIRPEFLDDAAFKVPRLAWPVDDIWLSGAYARAGIPVWKPAGIRTLCTALPDPGALQIARVAGHNRADANRACARWMREAYGIWMGGLHPDISGE